MGKRGMTRRRPRGGVRHFDDLGLAVLWIIGVAISLALMLAVLNMLLFGKPAENGPTKVEPPEERYDGLELVSAEERSTAKADPAPGISARSAVVMDLVSGRVLYEKNGREKAYPASTTKIMTVLLGLEYGQMDRRITVADEAVGVEGSSIYLVHGETISMEDLLYGAMLRSGNDAATAIAAEIGKDVLEEGDPVQDRASLNGEDAIDAFIALMNRRAGELGTEGTQFVNPTGLFDVNHYTTAYDMALMARAAMLHPGFAKIAGAKSWTAQRQEGRDPYFSNKNKVVHQYEGGTGVKIGYTEDSGRTLAASSERDGRKLICVVMDAPDWFNDSYRLMDWAYENYETVVVAEGGDRLERVTVEDGVRDTVWIGVKEDVNCLILPSEQDRVGVACAVRKPVTAPVRRGDVAGQFHVYVSGEYVYSVPLYFLEDVDGVRE